MLSRRSMMFKRMADSPYNASTTEYFRTNYGEYFDAIISFGLRNPDLVSYINEDNDMIISLVNVGKERFIYPDSYYSYIDTGFKPAYNDSVELRIKFVYSGQTYTFIGSRNTAGTADSGSYCLMYSYSQVRTDWASNSTVAIPTSSGIDSNPHTISVKKGFINIDGTSYNYSLNYKECRYNMYLFACNNAGNPSLYDGHSWISYVKCGNKINLIPYVKSSGKVTMLDIISKREMITHETFSIGVL